MHGMTEGSTGNCPVCRKVFHAKDIEHVLSLVGSHSSNLVSDLLITMIRIPQRIHFRDFLLNTSLLLMLYPCWSIYFGTISLALNFSLKNFIWQPPLLVLMRMLMWHYIGNCSLFNQTFVLHNCTRACSLCLCWLD